MAGREHWEQVYRTKAPTEVSWYQSSVETSLGFLERAGAGLSARVIDVGGGASVFVDRLLDLGFSRPAVLDIADAALDAARARLGPQASAIEWIVTDVTTWRPSAPFNVWHDRAVFHFLTDPEARAGYAEALTSGLRPGGALIVATFSPDGPERCSGLPVQRWSVEALAAEFGPSFDLQESRLEQHRTPSGSLQAFTWALFRRR